MGNKNKTGFTLIELLVVIAIIGLLASVVLLALNSARAKSRDAKRLADMRQIATALELYYNDNTGYPAVDTFGAGHCPGTATTAGTCPAGLVPSYLGQIPQAPGPADNTCNAVGVAPASTTSQNFYNYSINGSTANANGTFPKYDYAFCLGAATGGYGPGQLFTGPSGITTTAQ